MRRAVGPDIAGEFDGAVFKGQGGASEVAKEAVGVKAWKAEEALKDRAREEERDGHTHGEWLWASVPGTPRRLTQAASSDR